MAGLCGVEMFGEDMEKDLENLQDNPTYLRARIRKLNNILDEKEAKLEEKEKARQEVESLRKENNKLSFAIEKKLQNKLEAMEKAGDRLVTCLKNIEEDLIEYIQEDLVSEDSMNDHTLGVRKYIRGVTEDFKRLKEIENE